MKAGEYWRAISPDEKGKRWLFLVLARLRNGRRVLYVAIKCEWDTRAPIIDSNQVWLFNSRGRSMFVDAYFGTFRFNLTRKII